MPPVPGEKRNRPEWTRKAGLAAQAFAFLGTLIGVFTVVIGIEASQQDLIQP